MQFQLWYGDYKCGVFFFFNILHSISLKKKKNSYKGENSLEEAFREYLQL